MKTTIVIALLIFTAAGVFYLASTYAPTEPTSTLDDGIDTETTPTEVAGADSAGYFHNQMVTLGIEDVGRPIEGFDASILMTAFPGLLPEDFSRVATFEGHYEIATTGTSDSASVGELVFVRDAAPDAVSSAERTISENGYAVLLAQLARRLNAPFVTRADVDALIGQINTAERIRVSIGESAGAFGMEITPLEVLEDSRCGQDVTCIQAGTVRVAVSITTESADETIEHEIILGASEVVSGRLVELLLVSPPARSDVTITPEQYVFTFLIRRPEV